MYGQEVSLREKIVNDYGKDLERLLRYLPYLDKKGGKDVQSFYEGDASFDSIPVPVYDSTLLGFIKEVKKTKFLYRNYPYVYRRLRINTPEDERRVLDTAPLRDIDTFRAILSKYVLEGQTKSVMWTRAVEEKIFVTVLDNLQKRFVEYESELHGKGLN